MTVTCLDSGDWTSTNFQCVIDCGSPSPIRGVEIPPGDTFKDSTLTLTCQSGYQPEHNIVASVDITCRNSGTWSPIAAAFVCLKECNEPTSIENAVISEPPPTGINVEGVQRTYTCINGYGAAGGSDNGQVTCTASGDWSDTNLVCLIDCGQPTSINGVLFSGSDTLEGDSRTLTCKSGWKAQSITTTDINCRTSGTWSDPVPAFNCLEGSTLLQWVTSVPTYSTQWNNGGFSANQVIGVPNVYPRYGDLAGAWASGRSSPNEYIDVRFTEKVYITSLDIYETFHAGGVKAIRAKDSGGNWHLLWSTTNAQDIRSSRIFSPTLQDPGVDIRYIRLEVDCSISQQWAEIDAVKMTGIKYA